MEPRRGKGAALRSGFAAATGDIIVVLDVDCSMHPREIVLLIGALLSGADFVKGSRFVQGGGSEDLSLLRMVGNWGLTQTVRALYGGSFSDLCYGYFAFWSKHSEVLSPRCDGFEVETFINLQALKAGFKIAEVPSFEERRLHGKSNLRTFPALWRNRHQNSFSASDINALPAAINCGRSRHKFLNSLHNLLVWWRLRHNAGLSRMGGVF